MSNKSSIRAATYMIMSSIRIYEYDYDFSSVIIPIDTTSIHPPAHLTRRSFEVISFASFFFALPARKVDWTI